MDLAPFLDLSAPYDAEAWGQHFRRGVRTWLLAGGSLGSDRCLGLPATPAKARRALRDAYLRQAGAMLGRAGWERAVRLAGAVQRFGGHQWPCWMGLPQAPGHATDLERLLYLAFSANPGRMPSTPQGMAKIIANETGEES